MRKVFVFLISISVVLLGGMVAFALYKSRPKAAKQDTDKIHPLVEVMAVTAVDVPMKLPSQGIVEAKRKTTLAAEVGGKIVKISDKFEAGGEFEEDEVILEIDDADYQANLAQSKSNLEEARMALITEEARATQAERDWKRLGSGGEASDLTLRKPQLASARAKVAAAEAAVEKADNDLRRTKVRAPYPARVEMTQADLGAFVGTGSPLLTIYSRGPYEVRLPLSLDEFAFIEQDKDGKPRSSAELKLEAAGRKFDWHGDIVRTEGQVERSSRSIYLVAEVDTTTDTETNRGTLLQPGLFVEAEVAGITLKKVFQVPLQAFRELDTVVVVSQPENKLAFRKVKVIWREGGVALVSEGLESGERVLLTEIPDVVEEMEVRVIDDAADEAERNKKPEDGLPEDAAETVKP
jgi:RND family efflux transporter MFP subunit